jgi:hypothetical protein
VTIRPKNRGLGFAIGNGSGSTTSRECRGANMATTECAEGESGAPTECAEGEPVFLAERIRRALQRLAPEERWLFNVRLREGPFEDLLISEGQLVVEMSGERPVLALSAGAQPQGHWRQGSNRAVGGLGGALPGEQGPTDLLGATKVGDIRAVLTDPLGATDVGDIRAVLAWSAGAQPAGQGVTGQQVWLKRKKKSNTRRRKEASRG